MRKEEFVIQKGIPENSHHLTKKEYRKWGIGAHSASHFTLEELKDYAENNDLYITHQGLITEEQAEKLDKEGIKPESWCRYTNMDGYVERTWTTEDYSLLRLIENLEERKQEVFHCSYDDKKHPEYDDKFRIVFWFDN